MLGEAFRTIAALQQEGLTGGDLGQSRPEVARLPGKDKRRKACKLRFDIGASSLPPDVKERLRQLSGQRLIAGDILLIDSREHRTQAQNRDAARVRLETLIAQASRRPKRRKPTRPTVGAREARLSSKKKRGATKQFRGRAGRTDE